MGTGPVARSSGAPGCGCPRSTTDAAHRLL